uniref:Uncharacterized protein n=1 Tax=Arundo donax TaxID=35708 RepID=A0A0A9GKD3_ARUDO
MCNGQKKITYLFGQNGQQVHAHIFACDVVTWRKIKWLREVRRSHLAVMCMLIFLPVI